MSTHHALLYISASTAALHELVSTLHQESEVVLYQLATLTIDDVRELLIKTAYQRPLTFKTRTILVAATSINREAQHALLKILEEPPATTKFVFWLPPGAVLLPTILSRVESVDMDEVVATDASAFFQTFLEFSLAARIELITKLTKNKDLKNLLLLSSGMRQYVTTHSSLDVGIRSQFLWCLSQLEVNGASKKMLWEEMALLLPVEAPLEK